MNATEMGIVAAAAVVAAGYTGLLVVIGGGINRDRRAIEANTAQLEASTASITGRPAQPGESPNRKGIPTGQAPKSKPKPTA